MIVVLTGTSPYSFDRLVRSVDKLAHKKNLDVFVQLGYTQYEPKHCSFQRFVPNYDLITKIQAAEMVICHGGFGSIRDGLAHGKPVVAVPRTPENGEAQHYQEELLRELESEGRILAVYDIKNLSAVIDKARKFKVYHQKNTRIPEILTQYIGRL